MKVEICIGSSCHVKGGKEILERLLSKVKEKGLEGKVALAGTTCCGLCKNPGVNIKIDGVPVPGGVTPEGFDSFFDESIASMV